MIPTKLREKYYITKVRVKHMGANKKDKLFYTVEWNPEMSRRDFLREFEEEDMRGCGLFLCQMEQCDMKEDRWWDVDGYREEAVKDYRGRIARLRKRYALSKSDVQPFMRVNG